MIPLDSVPISTIWPADLRTNPDRYKDRPCRRSVVEVIAYQTADPLRKGLRIEEPYLLAPRDRERVAAVPGVPARRSWTWATTQR